MTIDETQEAILSSSLKSAAGSDEVSYRVVAAVHRANKDLLPKLFSELLYRGRFPKQWKEAKCVPIPKPGKTDTTNPKNLRPISLLSCLGKTIEKILATRLADVGRATGAITNEQYGSLAQRFSIDGLMTNLTTAQEWLRGKSAYKNPATKSSLLANDIDDAFNCVNHEQLATILTRFRFPKVLVATMTNFNTNRTIKMAFDSREEELVPFRSAISQGSPLSPIRFVIYATALNDPGHQKPTETSITYVDDEMMIQGAKTQSAASVFLETRLDNHLRRAEHLNIRFATNMTELMRLITHSTGRTKITDTTGITLYSSAVIPKTGLKSLGIWIGHRLSFKAHAVMTTAKTRRWAGFLWRIIKRKGVTPGALHHLATTTTIPAMLWGSEAWWTGAQHIIGQLPRHTTR